MVGDELRARAEQWLADDPDPATRSELRRLLDAPDPSATDLADRFAGSLEFGTAGLRGVLGAGPNRMNRAVVARATWGLARELLASVEGAAQRGLVVGGDARRLSPELTEDVAAIAGAAGLRVLFFSEPVPTPLVAFAVQRTGAAGGVVVTASHNPAEYSGYKVYWENGAQIVPPVDAAIAAAIARAPPARHVPRPALADLLARGVVTPASADLERAYLEAVAALAVRPRSGDRRLSIVYTPLHGVGDKLARSALAAAGFHDVTSVPEQARPDAAFPTVSFPNPEEPGAMDLALSLAGRLGADLVLANDPDADRLGVAARRPPPAKEASPLSATSPSNTPPELATLTGNQVGVLLGWYLLRERPAKPRRAILSTVVSSPMLGRIAAAAGAHYEETLTGFKWIASRALALEREGYEFVFGYEEALGYCIGSAVRDKDGISAAVLVAEMAGALRERGSSLFGALEDIAGEFGAFASRQRTLVRPGARGAAEIAALMSRLRARPPEHVAGDPLRAVTDFGAGRPPDRSVDGVALPGLPPSNVLSMTFASGARIVARPSGTEPKAKFYFDVREEVRPGEPARVAGRRAEERAEALAEAFMESLPIA